MSASRKILAILESRATYGYSKNVMREMESWPELELQTIVTGMHLIPELGYSIDLIQKDGFPITETIPLAPKDGSRAAWPDAMGNAMSKFARAIDRLSPDIVLLFGDRAETFTCALSASYMSVPTAHVQAGDKSGHIDDVARMAMAKLVNIHLASCEDSVKRLKRLGEEEFRIFQVGAPQLDNIVGTNHSVTDTVIEGIKIDLSTPYILFVQHSVLVERSDVAAQIRQTLNAILKTGLPVYWIFPNSDPGYQDIISLMSGVEERVTILKNVERGDYLKLLANCTTLIGNSSSGILEAPSFKIPVINIGNRQRGRPQAVNILNCDYDSEEITDRLEKVLGDAEFQNTCEQAVNPYGDGKSSSRICKILKDITIDQNLIDKQTIY